MGADNLSQLCTLANATYRVHPKLMIHTGGGISFGCRPVYCKSSKQKLNTKSSTEAEVVGVSDYLLFSIWICLFMAAQGYDIKNNILFQDNQSAIKMEKNGKTSCTGNSRHINIQYFFVKDQVDSNNMSIAYCSTEHMLADFFTKYLQGSLFVEFCEVIVGWNTHRCISDGTALNQGVCWKCG